MKQLCVDSKVQETIGDVHCPTCRNEKSVCISTNKRLVSTTVRSAKPAVTFWIFLLRTKNSQIFRLAVMVHIDSQERRVANTKKKSHLQFWRIFSANQFQANANRHQKRLKWEQIWKKHIRFLLADDLSNILFFQIILFKFNLLSTSQLAINFQKFSVSNDGIQWNLDFGPYSVTITLNDFVQNITISSQEIPLAAWKLLLPKRQYILDDHLPRVPITENQEGTMEMRDEVLSSVGAQDLDTSSYQVSNLEYIEFNWENSQLETEAVFRPGIDTPFSPTTFDDLSIGRSVENPIVLSEEEYKMNSRPPPTSSTPESVRPTEPPRLQRSRVPGARIENVPDYVCRSLFQ